MVIKRLLRPPKPPPPLKYAKFHSKRGISLLVHKYLKAAETLENLPVGYDNRATASIKMDNGVQPPELGARNRKSRCVALHSSQTL